MAAGYPPISRTPLLARAAYLQQIAATNAPQRDAPPTDQGPPDPVTLEPGDLVPTAYGDARVVGEGAALLNLGTLDRLDGRGGALSAASAPATGPDATELLDTLADQADVPEMNVDLAVLQATLDPLATPTPVTPLDLPGAPGLAELLNSMIA